MKTHVPLVELKLRPLQHLWNPRCMTQTPYFRVAGVSLFNKLYMKFIKLTYLSSCRKSGGEEPLLQSAHTPENVKRVAMNLRRYSNSGQFKGHVWHVCLTFLIKAKDHSIMVSKQWRKSCKLTKERLWVIWVCNMESFKWLIKPHCYLRRLQPCYTFLPNKG